MKAISKIFFILITILPISLFAHDGHIHTGTFWENASHFMLTNVYLFFPIALAVYFLFKALKARQKV
jgi:hypothetical protein